MPSLSDAAWRLAEAIGKRNGWSMPDSAPPAPATPQIIPADGTVQHRTAGGDVNPYFLPEFYDCPICGNTGSVIWRDAHGRLVGRACECIGIRQEKRNAAKYADMSRKSGLDHALHAFTFERYVPEEPWMARCLELAREYAGNPAGWFYIGGVSGCGKTHLCTAICGELLRRGVPVAYLPWRDIAGKAKAAAADGERYAEIVQPLKDVRCLFLDDFFKTGRSQDGRMHPTPGDVNFAYDLLNTRYLDSDSLTIISTELHMSDLADIDHAVMRRIKQRAGRYCLDIPDRVAKDWSMSHET